MLKQEEFLHSAHPIDPDMREQVMAHLRVIEAQHDVRFIYANRLPSYLTAAPGRDVIEVPRNGDLDSNGWDLRKALGQPAQSLPVAGRAPLDALLLDTVLRYDSLAQEAQPC